MDKQKNNLIRSLSIVIVIVWLFIVMINATLSFTEGDALLTIVSSGQHFR